MGKLKISNNFFNNLSENIKEIAIESTIGYLSCRMFTNVNPINAALFNASAKLTYFVALKFFKCEHLKVLPNLVSYFISLPIAFLTTSSLSSFTIKESIKTIALTLFTNSIRFFY